MSDTQANRGAHALSVSRCRDPELAARILRRDYFDDPLPHLGDGVIRTLAHAWVAGGRDVYLMTAEADGAYAGFVFGHTLGPRFWRLFARRHPRHLPSLLLAALKMKSAHKLNSRPARPGASAYAGDDLEAKITALGIGSLPRPFAWPPAGSGGGIIPLLFVHPEQRGKGVAPHLLEGIADEMFGGGAPTVEAHIDLRNLPSARAFLKAGFEVYRMSTGDLWARKAAPQ